jgi:hypothetical protein
MAAGAVRELSDAEVFGTASPTRELSDEEVFGKPEPGLMDRARIMGRDAFEQSGTGTVIRRNTSGQAGFDQVGLMDEALGAMSRGERVDPRNPYARIPAQALQRARDTALLESGARQNAFLPAERARRAEVEALPSFADDPTLVGKATKGAVNIGAMLVGGAPSPENLIPVGRGATLARTFAKGAAVNAAAGVPADVAAQQQDVQLGLQEGYDPARTAINAGLGGVIGGTVNAAPQAAQSLVRGIRERYAPKPDVAPTPLLPEPDMTTRSPQPAQQPAAVALPVERAPLEGEFRRVPEMTDAQVGLEPTQIGKVADDVSVIKRGPIDDSAAPTLREGAAPDAELLATGRPKPVEKDTTEAPRRPLHDMTPDEIRAELGRSDEDWIAATDALFGADGERYRRLSRSNSEAAFDRASELESRLSDEQHKRLEAAQQNGVSPEHANDFLQAHSDARMAETPQQLGESLRWAITRIGRESDPAKMDHKQRTAWYELKSGLDYARERGWDTSEVSKAAIKASAARFGDPADAEFMLSRFAKSESARPAPVERAPSQLPPERAAAELPHATQPAREATTPSQEGAGPARAAPTSATESPHVAPSGEGVGSVATNSKPLEQITVKVKTVDVTTGKTGAARSPAHVALRDVDEQISRAKALLECLNT